MAQPAYTTDLPVAHQAAAVRAQFLTKVYAHLAVAVEIGRAHV